MSRFSAPDAKKDLRPVDATSLVLLREGPVRPEVFLLERSRDSAFLGGALVFPGGKLDAADGRPPVLERARFSGDIDRQEPSPGRTWDGASRRAAAVAGIRELFEEAGVLLVRKRGEEALVGSSVATELSARRGPLAAGETALEELLEVADLELAGDVLVYLDHWITPSTERRRFDARFFLAALPPEQEARADETETVRGEWATATDALSRASRGEVFLAPPTQRILETLETAESVAGALELARARVVEPILPRIGAEDGRIVIHLPWSPAYAELEGEGAPVSEAASARRFAPVIVVTGPDDVEPSPEVPAGALEVLRFWFGEDLERAEPSKAIAARWWKKDPGFDAEIRERFGALREQAAAGELDAWQGTPEGALALVVLLDQMSRNLFRGSPRAFESDSRALAVAEAAVARGDDRRLTPMLRAFFYMPMMHAEDLGRQRACRLAFARLAAESSFAEGSLSAADAHRAIIERFGRYPFRNEVLGRPSTKEEAEWLAEGNRGF